MIWITFLYFIIVIVSGISSYGNAGLGVAISGVLAPILSWAGGSWMRASFYGGKKILGLAMGVTSLCISYIWISYTGFHLTVFDDSIGGVFWVFSGFGIGYFTTRREDVY